ncbi:transketolase [Thermoplasmatales archaeon SW_10_69_26]|nr:MAG: transketolase [Thermoplasmatales archaeon SW_10_69_26]
MASVSLAQARRELDDDQLEQMARRVRRDVLKMTHLAGSGHPGGSFSMTELLVTLYTRFLDVDPDDPDDPERDRFILSKGHCCPGHYALLARMGFFDRDELWNLRRFDSFLQGHEDLKVPGCDVSTGSLGQGLSYANGCALAADQDERDFHTWVMLGDGEVQEGQVWEAAMTAAHRKLDNLTAIVDYNKIQIDGFVNDVKGVEPLAAKWRAFGWHVIEIDGHDLSDIESAYNEALDTEGKPTLILAHTVKGKGVSFMENKAEFHGRALSEEEMEQALQELGEEVA